MENENSNIRKEIFGDEDFKKSSHSPPINKPWRCVLVAKKNNLVAVRDSKDSGKTTLVFTNEEWSAFIKGAKAGEFDL